MQDRKKVTSLLKRAAAVAKAKKEQLSFAVIEEAATSELPVQKITITENPVVRKPKQEHVFKPIIITPSLASSMAEVKYVKGQAPSLISKATQQINPHFAMELTKEEMQKPISIDDQQEVIISDAQKASLISFSKDESKKVGEKKVNKQRRKAITSSEKEKNLIVASSFFKRDLSPLSSVKKPDQTPRVSSGKRVDDAKTR